MAIKYVSVAVPAVAAGQQNNLKPVTFDDRITRRLTGIYSTLQTKLVQLQVDVAGTVVATIDAAAFNATNGPLPIDASYPTGVQLSVTVINNAAGAVAAATDEIVLRYEV